jgi:hypothetical protein
MHIRQLIYGAPPSAEINAARPEAGKPIGTKKILIAGYTRELAQISWSAAKTPSAKRHSLQRLVRWHAPKGS